MNSQADIAKSVLLCPFGFGIAGVEGRIELMQTLTQRVTPGGG